MDDYFKLIVVGESSVGKTSLIRKYCCNNFDDKSQPTIGSDFSTKTIQRRHKEIKLQIWDTAGQEKFNSVSMLFVRKSVGCIIVSDVTQEEQSLIHSINWKNLVQSYSEHMDQLPIFLVQNKMDMLQGPERKTFQSPSYLEELCSGQGFSKWFQVSTRKDNVEYIFEELVDLILERKLAKIDALSSSSFSLQHPLRTSSMAEKYKRKKGCCTKS